MFAKMKEKRCLKKIQPEVNE